MKDKSRNKTIFKKMRLSFIKSHKKQIGILFLVISCLLFLVIKLFATYEMHRGRTFPVELDDSTFYISTIYKIANYGIRVENSESYKSILHYINKNQKRGQESLSDKSDYIYFSWSSIWAIVHKITSISPERLYRFNFYFGIFAALGVLIYFGYRVVSFNFIGFLLITLAFFYGGGRYHGFFWVVPSFYALIFSILLIPVIFKSEHFLRNLLIILPFYIFLHPLSLMLFFIIGLLFIFYSLLNKGIDKDFFKRTITFYLIGFIVIISYLILRQAGIIPKMLLIDLQSIKNLFLEPKAYKDISEAFLQNKFQLFFKLLGLYYPGFLILLIVGLTALLSDKNYVLLSLFLSVFFINFTMVFFTPRFLRFILFTKTVLFIVIAFGIYKVAFFRSNKRIFLKFWGGYLGLFLIFACLATISFQYLAWIISRHRPSMQINLYLIFCLIMNYFLNSRMSPERLKSTTEHTYILAILFISLIFIGGFTIPQIKIHKSSIEYSRTRHPYKATLQQQEYFKNQIIKSISSTPSCILYDNYDKLIVEYAMLNGLLNTPSAFISTLKKEDFHEIFSRYENIYYITFRDYINPPRKPVKKSLDRIKAQISTSGLRKFSLTRIHQDYSLPIQIYKFK